MKQLIKFNPKSEGEKALLIRCRNAIKDIDPSVEVILYGSRARDDAGPESDYDLLILTDGQVTLKREDDFRRQLFPIELETGAVLTVIMINKKDWNSSLYDAIPLYQNIKREGIVL
jgi:predicted nucleotidyltransferase